MRRIVITFTEEDKYLKCFTDFGSDKDGTEEENKIANKAQPLIKMALMQVNPAKLSAWGCGDTMEEANSMAALQIELNELSEDV